MAVFSRNVFTKVGLVASVAILASLSGCKKRTTVRIDGSSTVYPITQAVAEEFNKSNPEINPVVGESGTGGGFEKFIAGETDLNDASRPIKDKEKAACKKAGIEYLELKIAIDGLSVVVHKDNDWCDAMTTEQLKSLWKPGSKIKNWSDLNPNWPDKKIKLYGPDTKSGTFDYFTEVICGKSGKSHANYQPSTDDNQLVKGVAGDKYALGYFGYSYFVENKDKIKAIGIAKGSDIAAAVKPTKETIENGTYNPLSRPLFLYVRKDALKRPEVAAFMRYYLNDGMKLVSQVGYVNLSEVDMKKSRETLEAALK